MSRQQVSLGLVVVLAATLGAVVPSAYANVEAIPTPIPAEEDKPIVSFVPRAQSISVQKSTADPKLGNTLVVVTLSSDEIKRLNKETGRTDLFAVGGDDGLVLFRDDGEEGDQVARDGNFSSLADIDPDDLAARAAEEGALESAGNLRGVPIFENRALVGEAETRPFNLTAFNAGQATPLSPSGSISSAVASAFHHENENGISVMSAPAIPPGMNQFQDRVLMIQDPTVVADPTRTFDPCTNAGTPMGPWTFGHVMTEMANQAATGINPSTFVENWLLHWAANQTINSFTVPQRLDINTFIADWRAASGGGDLDLSIAPFRLLAINPRIDLRTTVGGGGGYGGTASGVFLDAGEARFTFGVVLPSTYGASKAAFFNEMLIPPAANNCHATPFSVILEYRVPKCKCEDVRAWAKAWVALDDLVPGSNAYNGRLEKLTRTFTDRNANRARPNGSAIGQVRSNEIALHPGNFLWEIREFQLRQMPWSLLLETTTADTPDDSFNNGITFGNFVLDTIAGLAGPPVPLFYPLGSAQNFLGANPQTPFPPATFFWNAPNLNVALPPEDQGRHLASLGTCNGCHAGETLTDFVHIDPNTPGLPANLSGFLTGITVNDPAGSGTVRTFDDLDRREVDINKTARMLCANFAVASFSTATLSPVPLPGPLSSGGGQVSSISAPVATDPDAPPVSLAIEDFLREALQQVH